MREFARLVKRTARPPSPHTGARFFGVDNGEEAAKEARCDFHVRSHCSFTLARQEIVKGVRPDSVQQHRTVGHAVTRHGTSMDLHVPY